VDNALRALFGDVDVDPFALEEVKKQIADVRPQQLKSVVGAHFFGKWSRKVNFHRRWIPMPLFENRFIQEGKGAFPVLRALQSQQSIAAINHTAGRIGDNGSIWDILQAIYSQMYYEVGLISTPSAVKVDRKTGEILGPFDNEVRYVPSAPKETVLESSLDGRSLSEEDRRLEAQEASQASFQPQDFVTGVEARLTSYTTKPQLIFAVPPACNVLWESMIMRHQYSENYREQPTRLVISEGNLFNTIAGEKQDHSLMEYINLIQAVGYPNDAQEGLDRRLGRRGNVPNAYINPHNLLVWPEEFFKGPVYINRSIPPWFMYLSFSQDDPAVNQRASKNYKAIGKALYEWADGEKKAAEAGITRKESGGLFGDDVVTTDTTKQKLALDLREFLKDLEAARKEPISETPKTTFDWISLVVRAEKLGYKRSQDKLDTLKSTSYSDGSISSQRVYRLYAKYEYYRAKYGKRNGAAATIFNPYLVPAYPLVVWDDNETQYHTFGYAVTITHSLTAMSAQTTVNYSFGRTFGEFFDELVATRQAQGEDNLNEADPEAVRKRTKEILDSGQPLSLYEQEAVDERNDKESAEETSTEKQAGRTKNEEEIARKLAIQSLATPIDAVPANPIQDVRIMFQRNAEAAEVYNRMFWRNAADSEFPIGGLRQSIFDVWEMVSFVEQTDAGEQVRSIPTTGNVDLQDFDSGFVPAEKYKRYAENPDEAMQFASRPICTLDEWIQLQREYGIPITTENKIAADAPRQGKGAPYAAKILNLAPGPGSRPIPTEAGNVQEPINADTRLDWQSRLLRLREKFYNRDEPKTA
jgi:hypothetical protein